MKLERSKLSDSYLNLSISLQPNVYHFPNNSMSKAIYTTNLPSQYNSTFSYINYKIKPVKYLNTLLLHLHVSEVPLFLSNESLSILEQYQIFRYSSFINFFTKHQIDVPRCFKPVRSIRRLNFELPILKFINFLSKNGKKEKIIRILTKCFHTLFKFHKSTPNYTKNLQIIKWTHLYFSYNVMNSKNTTWRIAEGPTYLNTLNQHFIKNRVKHYSDKNSLKTFILRYLLFLQPLFSFSLFSLDKKAKKRARKKGSKYVFIWKYVPVYKRNQVLLKLIAKDIKFNAGKTLENRLKTSLDIIYNTPNQSQAYLTNSFTHNYVFKNFKKSLLNNFRTTA